MVRLGVIDCTTPSLSVYNAKETDLVVAVAHDLIVVGSVGRPIRIEDTGARDTNNKLVVVEPILKSETHVAGIRFELSKGARFYGIDDGFKVGK